MTVPALSDVFGANASQSSTQIVISKADLASVGLTASATNTAGQLFAAIMLLAAQYYTVTQQNNNNDCDITIAQSFQSLATRNNSNYRQTSYTINLQKPDTTAVVSPNDY